MDVTLNGHTVVVNPVSAEGPGPNGYARAEAYCLNTRTCGWQVFGRASTVIELAVEHADQDDDQ